MTLGQRIDQRRRELGLSQAELARRVGIRQSTMNALINGDHRSSRSIVQIAQELRTTPAFLTGQIDDPDEGAPLPPPVAELVHVMLPVALPGTDALAQMFEGLLEVVDGSASLAERARELAELLPTGLSAIRAPLIAQASPRARAADAPALASAGPASRR